MVYIYSVFKLIPFDRNEKSTGLSENLNTNKILMKLILLQKHVNTHHSVFIFFWYAKSSIYVRWLVYYVSHNSIYWNIRCMFGIFSIIQLFVVYRIHNVYLLKNLPLRTISFPFLWESGSMAACAYQTILYDFMQKERKV